MVFIDWLVDSRFEIEIGHSCSKWGYKMSISHRLIFLRILVFKYFLLIDLLIDESNDGRTLFNQIFCNKRFSLTYLNLKGTCGKKKMKLILFFFPFSFWLIDLLIDFLQLWNLFHNTLRGWLWYLVILWPMGMDVSSGWCRWNSWIAAGQNWFP